MSYHAALEVYTRQELPQDWAVTQNNLGNALSDQAGRTSGPEAVQLLADAVKACRAALEVYTESAFSRDHALVTRNLRVAESALKTARAQP